MPDNVLPSSVKFHYIKSNLFRVIHSAGAVGGVTPDRDIFVTLFNQRAALPKVIEVAISPDGRLGNEMNREGKEGIVREMEIGIVMNARAAEDLAQFLTDQVRALKESIPETQNESKS